MANETPKSRTRPYRKRRRAEQERQTRQRIVEAAVKLHGTVGPAQTTISGVADEAGVQRATVYRHFSDEESLFSACSAHYWASHPRPDPEAWAAIEDPAERLRVGLGELYEWFEETEQMLARTGRDIELVPAMAGAVAEYLGYLDSLAVALAAGRGERGRARERVRAALGHAVTFTTWQTLVRGQGLDRAEAVELMATLVEAAGRLSLDGAGAATA